MPIFDFQCYTCGHTTEKIVKSDVVVLDCPQCDTGVMEKQVAAPGGFKFNGKGFYETDFKKKR